MATRAKAASPVKAPGAGKTRAVPRDKPAAKAKATAAKPAKPVAPKKSAATAPAKAGKSTRPKVSEEQRRNYIEVAAYYIAERRGFFGASALEDWAQAEAEVDRMLREGRLNK